MAICLGFSAEDLNGARLLCGSVDALVSRLDQELYAIWKSASTSTIKRFGFVLRSDSTEPRNASRVLNLVLQLLAVQDQGITGLFDRKFLREYQEKLVHWQRFQIKGLGVMG